MCTCTHSVLVFIQKIHHTKFTVILKQGPNIWAHYSKAHSTQTVFKLQKEAKEEEVHRTHLSVKQFRSNEENNSELVQSVFSVSVC